MSEVVRYSEAFKRRVVENLERGMYRSLAEARRKNGIKGNETLVKWIKHYGREDILPKRVTVETMKEVDELKAARKEIKELKAALADAHVDWCLESAFLDIACKRLGTTAEELKKKNAITLAEARRRKGAR